MSVAEWAIWGAMLFAQQFTFLFSTRAKSSGSIRYSALAGIGSHGTWFFAQVLFVRTVLDYADASFVAQLGVALFYMAFTIMGTVSAQWIALKWAERGKMRVGAR
jgi:hypothetical protein